MSEVIFASYTAGRNAAQKDQEKSEQKFTQFPHLQALKNNLFVQLPFYMVVHAFGGAVAGCVSSNLKGQGLPSIQMAGHGDSRRVAHSQKAPGPALCISSSMFFVVSFIIGQ